MQRILGDLTYLQWSELHPPADGGVGGRRLEPHTLPVGGLNVLSDENVIHHDNYY